MVYRHFSRVRVMRARQPGDALLLTDLADELLLAVIDHLPIDDVLKLRSTCRNLTPVCNTAVQGRLKVLYIHGRDSSLKAAVEICEHPFFGENIEEVALLGAPTWPEHDGRRFRERKGWSHLLYRSWPSTFPGHDFDALDSSSKQDSFQQLVNVTCQVLLVALRKLPKLRKLSFLETVSQPGWNQSSREATVAHAEKHGDARWDQKIKTRYLPPGLRYSDLEMLFELLMGFGDRLQELDATTSLPVLSNFHQKRVIDGRGYRILELHCMKISASRKCLQWTATWGVCLSVAPALRSLHLVAADESGIILPNTRIATPGVVVRHLTDHCSQRLGLQALELTASSDPFVHRVQLQSFDLIGFMLKHGATLQSVRIRNILLTTRPSEGILASVENVLTFITKPENDEIDFQHKLARLSHVDGAHDPGHQCVCTIYGFDAQTAPSGVSTNLFDALASRLAINLDHSTQEWNFGDYVERIREERRKRIGA